MSSIAENLNSFRQKLEGTSCKLVAVSKTKPVEMLQEAYDADQRIFGENKVQELVDKHEVLPKDIQWHMIGHLQRNKVKYIAPFVSLIHSIDSPRLLNEVQKRAAQNDRVIDCLLQIFIAEEETKFGFSKEEVTEYLSSAEFQALKNIRVVGVMGMATNTSDETQVQKEFASLKTLFTELKEKFNNLENVELSEISMGMSGDFPIAIKEGSTMIRVGSAIFGARNYGAPKH
ncbi:YggS family pyridoxal phosphate-dependent enzyme [Flammeovirga sp. EKP202]|uniref:YggS family pyridoxal phosphate-dependent enzyme n=1 Tax=Flammeovirga sp. EKP202 TaxID=2770592 RepID=UPI00165F5048|nr:YggS family pyridoxal phosphate-dependent enzyme [Flammeovirga sp. EKP202]MBD0399874.1 YggS family pyridoxal phosphate-dependent enzyme [Flammeovirga sp. EKP202]